MGHCPLERLLHAVQARISVQRFCKHLHLLNVQVFAEPPAQIARIRDFDSYPKGIRTWRSRSTLELVRKFPNQEGESFMKEEIEALLKACDFCDGSGSDRREKVTMRRATARRDRAIILTSIDSGLRVSELCSLRVADLDQNTWKITIRHGVNGGAKGGKARFVYLRKTARKAVWRYLAEREDGENAEAQLFLGKRGNPLNRDSQRQVIHVKFPLKIPES